VSKAVYHAFKSAGDVPITSRARVLSLETGDRRVARTSFTAQELELMRAALGAYGHLHAFELVRLTHEPGSPWHQVWHSEGVTPGMKISDEVIRKHFSDQRLILIN
jgi:uncharacterized phage-associated protein